MSRQSKGRNIINLLSLSPEEKVMSIINVREFDDKRQLVTATKNGTVKKTVLSAYSNPRNNGLIALKLEENDDLIGAAITSGQDEIILGTRDGMSIRFHESDVRSMGRVSVGVRGIKLREGDEVVDMVVAEPGASLLTICERGYGKRTDLEDYRVQSRGGLGLINIKTTERNGRVVALKAVHDDDELMMITANGMIVRTGLEEVRAIGRNTAGVRMISLKEGDKLVAVARLMVEGVEDSDSSSPENE
jgi:DNA gyrase subunit A